MAINPCCGGDLQRGTKIVAIIEIVWYTLELLVVIGLIIFIFAFGVVAASNDKDDKVSDTHWGLIAIGAVALTIIALVLCFTIMASLLFGVILLKGSNYRDPRKCKAWLLFRIVMLVVSLFSLLFGNVFAVWEILVTPYFIWVTYSFLRELKNESSNIGRRPKPNLS